MKELALKRGRALQLVFRFNAGGQGPYLSATLVRLGSPTQIAFAVGDLKDVRLALAGADNCIWIRGASFDLAQEEVAQLCRLLDIKTPPTDFTGSVYADALRNPSPSEAAP